MKYAAETIRIIHTKRRASFNKIYTDYSGNTYIGTREGYLKLQKNDAINKEIAELKKEINSTKPLPAPAPVEPELEKGSYFDLDANGDLSPLDGVHRLLSTNIFELDVDTGDLTIRSSSPTVFTDEFFIIDGSNDITISNTITG
jgi:hypothetical protein